MMASFRSYRLLRIAVAVTLVMGVMLPIVHYACAMNGLSMTSSVAQLAGCVGHDAGMMAKAEACSMSSSTLCPEDAPCPSSEGCTSRGGDELSCCTEETVQADNTTILESKLTLAHVILPVVAFLTAEETVSALSVYLSPTHELYGDSGGGVSLRVLYASFLL